MVHDVWLSTVKRQPVIIGTSWTVGVVYGAIYGNRGRTTPGPDVVNPCSAQYNKRTISQTSLLRSVVCIYYVYRLRRSNIPFAGNRGLRIKTRINVPTIELHPVM